MSSLDLGRKRVMVGDLGAWLFARISDLATGVEVFREELAVARSTVSVKLSGGAGYLHEVVDEQGWGTLSPAMQRVDAERLLRDFRERAKTDGRRQGEAGTSAGVERTA